MADTSVLHGVGVGMGVVSQQEEDAKPWDA